VAAGLTKLAETHALSFSIPKLALFYLIVGLFVNLLKGILTEALTRILAHRENIEL